LLLALLASSGRVSGQDAFAGKIPITGKAGPGLETLDRAVAAMMARHGIPGAALAIAKDGRLVLAKGYGWADLAGAQATPETLFALSSLSKPITAIAVLLLIEQGKLKLDDLVINLLAHIPPPRGARVDPRFGKITIRHLLNHSGGWNRAQSGDPVDWARPIGISLGVPQPITTEQFISFVQTVPLNFEPGTQAHYSNIGYILLGAVIEKVSGQSYEQHVRAHVLEPMGITRARLHRGETKYYDGEARRYLAGTDTVLPPLQRPYVSACGGWSASAVDMARFLTAVDCSRGKKFLSEESFVRMLQPPPPPLQLRANGTYNSLCWFSTIARSEGFSYAQDGSNHGSRAFMKRNLKGINWVLLFNASMEPDPLDTRMVQSVLQEVREQVDQIADYPALDLFKEFP